MPKRPEPAPSRPTTTTVIVVVTPGVLLLDLAGVAEPFRIANRLSGLAGAVPAFALSVAGARKSLPSSLPIALSGIAPLPKRLPHGAWVVVVGVADQAGGPKAERERCECETAAWLARSVGPALASGSARLWTVCSGALLAARAGLLDGRQCTTHHSLIGQLA